MIDVLVHGFLRDSARLFADRTYIVVGDDEYSFARIDQDSDRLAVELQRTGSILGERVVVMLENSVETVIALWATLKAGAVFIPLHPATKAEKLAFILTDSGACCLIAPAVVADLVAVATKDIPTLRKIVWVAGDGGQGGCRLCDVLDAPHVVPEDPGLIDQDLSLIIYTSGSTGHPKGVMMTHRSIRNNVWSTSTFLGNVPEDVVLCVLPLSFNYGLQQVLSAARVGFTVVLERSFAYPYEVLKRMAERHVTGLPGVPTIFASLLRFAPFTGLDLSAMRYLSNTAAPFPPAHIQRFRELVPQATIFSMFGLTECTRVSGLDPAKLERKPTSVGQAIPNSKTYIVNERGVRLGVGETGELVVRGTNVMRGYWRRPVETANALRDGDLPGEQVLYTGDLFRADAEGDLYFVGRKDDVFKNRGGKVSPKEIENVLYELDAIAEAAVIGVADPIEGMAIKAFVVIREGHAISEQQVRAHCLRRLESRLVPKWVELCASLPKTDSGKITKSVLRAQATASV